MRKELSAILINLVREFSKLKEVEAILLSGSKTNHMDDAHSDYDLYIYSTKEIPIEERKIIARKYFIYTELNNQFWRQKITGFLEEQMHLSI